MRTLVRSCSGYWLVFASVLSRLQLNENSLAYSGAFWGISGSLLALFLLSLCSLLSFSKSAVRRFVPSLGLRVVCSTISPQADRENSFFSRFPLSVFVPTATKKNQKIAPEKFPIRSIFFSLSLVPIVRLSLTTLTRENVKLCPIRLHLSSKFCRFVVP